MLCVQLPWGYPISEGNVMEKYEQAKHIDSGRVMDEPCQPEAQRARLLMAGFITHSAPLHPKIQLYSSFSDPKMLVMGVMIYI